MTAAAVAAAALIGAIAALVTSIGGVVVGLRNTRKLSVNAVEVQKVHELVNSQLSTQIRRADAAEGLLTEHGIDIPLDD